MFWWHPGSWRYPNFSTLLIYFPRRIVCSVVDIEACVRPETSSHVRPVFGGEAGTLTVLLERSPEDPLVTPAQTGVVQEGPAGNLPAEAVADEAALVDGGEDQG